MVKSNTRAISRVVLHHRDRAVLLEPRDKGMILWTLRYGDEVLREAMVKSNTRAISRVVLHHRDRAVLLEPRDKGMILWTLRYGDEVRDEADYLKGLKGKPDPKEKKLLARVIAEHTQGWSPSLATDP